MRQILNEMEEQSTHNEVMFTAEQSPALPRTEKLFVYGIFLDERNRDRYGMSDPQYATVMDYVTVGGHIVQAVHRAGFGYSLTGLIVDMDSERWEPLDMLEMGYSRVRITTTDGEEAWMYAERYTWENE